MDGSGVLVEFIEGEKPKNDFRAFRKYFWNDFFAGLTVSLVSVGFSLAIAIASGAPPITGLISAIIAGLVLPFLGGSYVTISGPAAGLAPVLFSAMLTLGGSAEAGYPLLLVAICLTGLVQVFIARQKWARHADVFPTGAVKGMLCGIGLMVFAKEIPHFLGETFHSHHFFGILLETPAHLDGLNSEVVFVGATSLGVIAVLSWIGSLDKRPSLQHSRVVKRISNFLKRFPPMLWAGVYGIAYTWVSGLEPIHRIHIPNNPFEHGITFPHFDVFFQDITLLFALVIVVAKLTLIDGIESLATISGVDRMDPYQRKSDPDKTIRAMGWSNFFSSLFGGLTIIPGGIKSTANIMAGGKTQWANFWNAVWLIIFLVAATDVINMLPLSTLAAIVMAAGWKLCAPHVWKDIWHIGWEQFAVFLITIVVTLAHDLLWGIAAGVALELVLVTGFTLMAREETLHWAHPVSLGQALRSVFSCPVDRTEKKDTEWHVYITSPICVFNRIDALLEKVLSDPEATVLHFHYDSRVTFIDSTSHRKLKELGNEFQKRGGRVVLHGADGFLYPSGHRHGRVVRTFVPATVEAVN